jgi:hypothetical protein
MSTEIEQMLDGSQQTTTSGSFSAAHRPTSRSAWKRYQQRSGRRVRRPAPSWDCPAADPGGQIAAARLGKTAFSN